MSLRAIFGQCFLLNTAFLSGLFIATSHAQSSTQEAAFSSKNLTSLFCPLNYETPKGSVAIQKYAPTREKLVAQHQCCKALKAQGKPLANLEADIKTIDAGLESAGQATKATSTELANAKGLGDAGKAQQGFEATQAQYTTLQTQNTKAQTTIEELEKNLKLIGVDDSRCSDRVKAVAKKYEDYLKELAQKNSLKANDISSAIDGTTKAGKASAALNGGKGDAAAAGSGSSTETLPETELDKIEFKDSSAANNDTTKPQSVEDIDKRMGEIQSKIADGGLTGEEELKLSGEYEKLSKERSALAGTQTTTPQGNVADQAAPQKTQAQATRAEQLKAETLGESATTGLNPQDDTQSPTSNPVTSNANVTNGPGVKPPEVQVSPDRSTELARGVEAAIENPAPGTTTGGSSGIGAVGSALIGAGVGSAGAIVGVFAGGGDSGGSSGGGNNTAPSAQTLASNEATSPIANPPQQEEQNTDFGSNTAGTIAAAQAAKASANASTVLTGAAAEASGVNDSIRDHLKKSASGAGGTGALNQTKQLGHELLSVAVGESLGDATSAATNALDAASAPAGGSIKFSDDVIDKLHKAEEYAGITTAKDAQNLGKGAHAYQEGGIKGALHEAKVEYEKGSSARKAGYVGLATLAASGATVESVVGQLVDGQELSRNAIESTATSRASISGKSAVGKDLGSVTKYSSLAAAGIMAIDGMDNVAQMADTGGSALSAKAQANTARADLHEQINGKNSGDSYRTTASLQSASGSILQGTGKVVGFVPDVVNKAYSEGAAASSETWGAMRSSKEANYAAEGLQQGYRGKELQTYVQNKYDSSFMGITENGAKNTVESVKSGAKYVQNKIDPYMDMAKTAASDATTSTMNFFGFETGAQKQAATNASVERTISSIKTNYASDLNPHAQNYFERQFRSTVQVMGYKPNSPEYRSAVNYHLQQAKKISAGVK